MCFYYCAKYILSAHICKKILSVTPGHPKTRQQTTNSVSPQEDEFMAVCHKTLTKKNLLSQQNVSILSLENVIFIFNFYRMEKVLLFLVSAIIGAYLTCRTAPLAARERKGGWLLHFLASSGIMFIAFILSFSVSVVWAIAALVFCAITIYATAYSLYRKKMKEHDPERIARQIDGLETNQNQAMRSTLNLFAVKDCEKNKRFHYQCWFEMFSFRFSSFCIAILCIRVFLTTL